MAFNLSANIRPEVDQQAAQQSGRELAQTYEDAIGDLSPGVGRGIGGGGGIGGSGGIGGLASSAGGAGLAGRAAGLASGGVAKVALAGAASFGILQAVQQLASASPALQQTFGILGDAFELFFRPWGRALSDTIRPFATAALDMAENFNDLAEDEGLAIALATVTADAATSLGTGFVNALGNIATGEGTLADFLFAGAGTIGLAKLVSSTSLSSLVTSSSIGGLLTSSSIGGLLTAVSAGTLITGGVAAGALIVGTVAASNLIETGFGPGKPEDFDPERELETFIQRNITGADPRLSPQEARRQAFQEAIQRAGARENLTRADAIAAFRDVTGREPPQSGVGGGGGRTGPRGGPPSGDEVDQLAQEQQATRQVLENIEQNTDEDGDGGLSDLTSGQLENLLPESAGQKYDPF